MAVAGTVAPVLRGDYDSTATYNFYHVVTHNNILWICKVDGTVGIEPTEENSDTWHKGIDGNISDAQTLEGNSSAYFATAQSVTDIVDGTTPAGTSTLLENFTAKQVGESGARNLIPYPYYHTTRTESGIEWTDNGDGSITANGTSTTNVVFRVTPWNNMETSMHLESGKYTISDTLSKDNTDSWIMVIKNDNGTRTDFAYLGNGKLSTTFEITEEESENCRFEIYIGIIIEKTVENLTFRPMLELGSVAHDYVPYHFGGAEDAAKLNGLTAEEFVSNENLLVNPYFLDPVNSSGETTWAAGSTHDGWSLYRCSATLTEDGVTITAADTADGQFTQNLNYGTNIRFGDEIIGQYLTLSISVDGVIYSATSKITSLDADTSYCNISLPNSNIVRLRNVPSIPRFFVQTLVSTELKVNWIKLELGSIATPFIPPNKEVEKLKCGVVDMTTRTATDLDAEYTNCISGFSVCTYNASTLNTPYTEGLLPNTLGKCITMKSTSFYGMQMALIGGSKKIVTREMNNGTFSKWSYSADGGNADTVDGYHASELEKNDAVAFASGETVLEWATTPNGIYKKFAVENIGYPSDGFEMEGFYILQKQAGRVNVLFYTYNRTNTKVYKRRLFNGSWSTEWLDITNYLPLDGSAPMSGNLIIDRNQPMLYLTNDAGDTGLFKLQEDGNLSMTISDAEETSCGISLLTSRGAGNMFRIFENGVGYTVLHTGNSNAIIKSTTAPTNTTAVWVDTANKVIKAYIDGAWTQVS